MDEAADKEIFLDETDSAVGEIVAGIKEFHQDYLKYQGLVTRSQVGVVLGVSKQRVADLIREGILEEREYGGVKYVTGRSLLARAKDSEHHSTPGGRPRKGLTWGEKFRFFMEAIRIDFTKKE